MHHGGDLLREKKITRVCDSDLLAFETCVTYSILKLCTNRDGNGTRKSEAGPAPDLSHARIFFIASAPDPCGFLDYPLCTSPTLFINQ